MFSTPTSLGFTFALDQDQEEGSRIFGYSDTEWSAVLALLPQPPKRELVWRTNIERAAGWVIEGDVPTPPTNSELATRWRRVASLAEELGEATREVLDEDGGLDLVDRACSFLLHQAEGWLNLLEARRSTRRSDNDPGSTRVLRGLLNLWTECGGKLSFSSGADKRPKGPLIRFLRTALAPVETAGMRRVSEFHLAYVIRKDRGRRSRLSGTDDFT